MIMRRRETKEKQQMLIVTWDEYLYLLRLLKIKFFPMPEVILQKLSHLRCPLYR